AMNGWDQVAGASNNGDNLTYAQYSEADIPNYWQYARTFALADRFFANVLGPSFPGHTFVLAAQAGWARDNPPTATDHPYWGWDHVVNASTFDLDVDHGDLPAVTWLVNQDLDDEHPGFGSVCLGENWTVGHLNHLMSSPLWKDTAILFTMDDFGGWYDHVPPP